MKRCFTTLEDVGMSMSDFLSDEEFEEFNSHAKVPPYSDEDLQAVLALPDDAVPF